MTQNVIQKILSVSAIAALTVSAVNAKEIIHDAEQAILEKQFGEKWAKQDIGINEKLATLEKKFGKKPKI